MIRRILLGCVILALSSAAGTGRTVQAEGTTAPYEFRDRDRVAMLGGTLIEREQASGYVETLLTLIQPERSLSFRNLGWSGDSVGGEARAWFGPPEEGFTRLQEQVRAVKPTIVLLGYGGNEAFQGKGGLAAFQKGLDRLADALQDDAPKARWILLTPPRREPGPGFTRTLKPQNEVLGLYRDVVAEFAASRHAPLIDLYRQLEISGGLDSSTPAITDNGLHLTAFGYWRVSAIALKSLGWSPPSWRLEIEAGAGADAVVASASASASGTKVIKASPTKDGDGLRFELLDQTLPAPPAPADAPPGAERRLPTAERWLKVGGLAEGLHELTIDGKPIHRATAAAWRDGVRLDAGPEFEQVESLRAAIIAKNRLYFHRYRPQNDTYLYGFRKQEQGQNARDLPEFDQLVEKAESGIEKIKRPTPHTYELKRIKVQG